MSLSNEDKEWMTAQDNTLRQEFRVQVDGLRQEFKVQNDGLRQEFKVQTDGLRQEFRDGIERVETSLLTEFHKWASPMELRVRSHAIAMRALDMEIEDVKDRLGKLEPPSSSRQ